MIHICEEMMIKREKRDIGMAICHRNGYSKKIKKNEFIK